MAISYLTPLLESWLIDRAPVKPSLKRNEPYIIYGRLRLTLSPSKLVLCFHQVKQCGCKGQRGRWHDPVFPCRRHRNSFSSNHSDRLKSFGACQLSNEEGWVDAERNAGFTCISPADRGLVTSLSQHSGLRLNVIHPLPLRRDFSTSTSQSHPAGTQKPLGEFPVASPPTLQNTTPLLFNTDTERSHAAPTRQQGRTPPTHG